MSPRVARTRESGFTLIELGIVIGVIAIMLTVIFTARGFIDASRVGTSVQLAQSVRDAARGFAMRSCGGAAFSCGPPAAQDLDDINKLVNPPTNFFDVAPQDPWGNQDVAIQTVGATNDQIRIDICLGNGDNSDELAIDFQRAGAALGPIAIGGNCGAAGTTVSVTTR